MSNSRTFPDSDERAQAEASGAGALGGLDLLALCLDTATETRSVAVVRGTKILSLRAQGLRAAGASSVLGDVDEALRAAEVGLREVGLFAACTGPGSFTGLRSGLATVKALSKTLGKPAVGVPTLHAIAFHARPAARLYALLPAGRGEVFAQLLSVGVDGRVRELGEAVHVSPAKLLEMARSLGGGLKWAGGGASKYLEQIEEEARASGLSLAQTEDAGEEPSGREWLFARTPEALAPGLAALASASLRSGREETAEGLRAIYVRPSDAELNEQCHEQG